MSVPPQYFRRSNRIVSIINLSFCGVALILVMQHMEQIVIFLRKMLLSVSVPAGLVLVCLVVQGNEAVCVGENE
jgi:hypothetical protein